jgi:hypothetical protein
MPLHWALCSIQLARRAEMAVEASDEWVQLIVNREAVRTQKGTIVRKGRAWYLRYYDTVLADGKPVRKKCCHRLAEYCDRYRSIKSVRSLAEDFLAPVNTGRLRPEGTTSVAKFIETEYLPWTARCKRPLRSRDSGTSGKIMSRSASAP